MTDDLDFLPFIDHLREFFNGQALNHAFCFFTAAVTGEGNRYRIENLRRQSAENEPDQGFRRIASGIIWTIKPPAVETVLSRFIRTPRPTEEGVCSDVAK